MCFVSLDSPNRPVLTVEQAESVEKRLENFEQIAYSGMLLLPTPDLMAHDF